MCVSALRGLQTFAFGFTFVSDLEFKPALRAAPPRSLSRLTRAGRRHDRQSPMKNFEVSFSFLELEFHCKNLFLIYMGKALGSKNLMVAFFISNPPPLHGRFYLKVGK